MGINKKRQRNPKEYIAWVHMTQRCNNANHRSYKNYGGRGITVCERWLKFENFLADVGSAPSPKLTLDRINNDGNYEPENVRWATTKEQSENKRSNKVVNGKTYAKISYELGGTRNLVNSRLNHGWSVQDAISKPFAPEMSRSRKEQEDRPKTNS